MEMLVMLCAGFTRGGGMVVYIGGIICGFGGSCSWMRWGIGEVGVTSYVAPVLSLAFRFFFFFFFYFFFCSLESGGDSESKSDSRCDNIDDDDAWSRRGYGVCGLGYCGR